MCTECGVSSIMGSYIQLGIFTNVCRVAIVGGGCCVDNVVFFVVTIAYLNEFTVLRGISIQYPTSILYPTTIQ